MLPFFKEKKYKIRVVVTIKTLVKMELKQEQINKFKELHKGCAGFEGYSEEEVAEIANGVANYYLALFKVHQRIKKEEMLKS